MQTVTAVNNTWQIDSKPAPPTTADPPAPNLPAYNNNMWVAGNVSATASGDLQLLLARDSGWIWDSSSNSLQPSNGPDQIWAAAEAVLVPPAGQRLDYGTYRVTFRAGTGTGDTQAAWAQFFASSPNTSTTFGVFTFDASAPAPFGELDLIEVGYQNQDPSSSSAWINTQPGGPVPNNAQFAIQPWDAQTPGRPDWDQIRRIALSSTPSSTGELTVVVNWSASSVEWFAAWGAFTSASFPYTGSTTIAWTSPLSASAIPTPTATMRLHVNLWPYGGPTTNQAVSFQVTGIEVPLTAI